MRRREFMTIVAGAAAARPLTSQSNIAGPRINMIGFGPWWPIWLIER